MSAGLRIIAAGPGVSVQDAGRRGFLRYGVTGAGPMDPLAYATANNAVGAAPGAPAIEVSTGGLRVAAEGGSGLRFAVAGGSFDVQMDGRTLPSSALGFLEPGETLSIRAGADGAWCYLALRPALDIPPVLGSVATHARSGLGGFNGRALQPGDLLPLIDDDIAPVPPAALEIPARNGPARPIRVVFGPQDDYFSPEDRRGFLERIWSISPRSDRMAYLLEGEPLRHSRGFNIVSDGIALGAIQVPGNGLPAVLMADRQPTGGYPKIANVIGPDIGRLAQLRPGASVRFTEVSIPEAVAARRAERELLDRPVRFKPLIRDDFPSEFLLGQNLIDGAVSA